MQVLTQSIPGDVHTWPQSNSVNRRIAVPTTAVATGILHSDWSDEHVARRGEGQVREDVVDDLENAPQAFISLLEGKRFGNLVVRVANDKPARTHGRQE
jgi:hypothetical protein